MKILLNILLLIVLTSCNSKSREKTIEEGLTDSSSIQSKIQIQDKVDFQFDMLKVNNQEFIQILKDRRFSFLLSMQGDTIIKPEDYYTESKFLDINDDGYTDIRVFAFSNTPNQCDNYLFDKKLKTFKLVEGCYLDIKKIIETDFFYSYNGEGCADMNWQSHLSKIENYKLVNYGYIYGQGCDFEIENTPQVIEIYKLLDSNTDEKKLMKKLPYKKHIKEFGDKWSFIEKYWTENYEAFEN